MSANLYDGYGWPRQYHEGYSEARENVERMELPALLSYIDALFGRDNLSYGDGVDQVRAEALRQCEREFTNPAWTREVEPFVTALRTRRL